MNSILLVILCTKYFFTYSVEPILCKNCKFFRKDLFTLNKFGKCSLFPIANDNEYFLVDGTKNTKIDYYYCSIARNNKNMCKPEGNLYVKK